jgi:outer membrane protein TolC
MNTPRKFRTQLLAAVLALMTAIASAQTASSFQVEMPKSRNPLDAYAPSHVPEPSLANSPRLDRLIRDGKLYLSLKDAIALTLENNLDLAIARYNRPIADTDILRTKAGGYFRGVNTGVVQNTVGGGVGGLGAGAPGAGSGAGAGGTTGGAGGAGAGASGLVQSTLGTGTNVSSYDPSVSAIVGEEHYTEPLSNLQLNGVPTLQANSGVFNAIYSQSFPTGTTLTFQFDNNRAWENSVFNQLNPVFNSYYRVELQQQLLAGFGFGPNLRYLRIAKNNKKISDIAFKDQVIVTVTQIADIYWDLVDAYEESEVDEQSLAFAQQSLDNAKKELQLQSIPAMDEMKAETEVSKRDQDLTVAKTNLELEESLIKNALTKSLDDPVLEAMPVIPTDTTPETGIQDNQPLADLVSAALQDRPELSESAVELINFQISRKAARNALLPSLSLEGFYGGTGLAGPVNPSFTGTVASIVPSGLGGAILNAYNNSAPDYYVGLNLQIPLRNRVAKADQYRSELEYRQTELRLEELKKQIRIEVRNARYALEQNAARVESARKARDLAQRTFEITAKEQDLGSGSSFQTLSAQHDLAVAQLDFVTATTTYEKAKVELDRATGTTLDHNDIKIQDAINGAVVGTSP